MEQTAGLSVRELLPRVNIATGRIERALKLLEIDGAVVREDGRRYVRTVNPWRPDEPRARRVAELRYHELDRMRAYVASHDCLMEFVARELDDPTARPCGRCASCTEAFVPAVVDPILVREATGFLQRAGHDILPRTMLPAGVFPERGRTIETALVNGVGRALCVYGNGGWGRMVRDGKYRFRRFDDRLVHASVELIRDLWRPEPFPCWVAAVPSLREPTMVPDFARRLAAALGLPYGDALRKRHETPPQKTMQNSAQQLTNIAPAMAVVPEHVRSGAVLLVDDIVDSTWTLTVCGARLRRAGSGLVHPFALAPMATAG